ncbi:MAG: sulfur oxidation c-type cytochrome SoxA, partial [Gammaproteobacteria bacterium]
MMMPRAIALVAMLFLPLELSAEPISGYDFLSPDTQAMQDDDFENPGMVAVEEGSDLFHQHKPDEEYACSSCHGEGGEKLDVKEIAKYPKVDLNMGGVVTLQARVNYCWETNLDRFPLEYGDSKLVALETFVRNLARGETVNVSTDGEAAPFMEKAEKLYRTRWGQINMSCYHCHVQHQGQKLRAQTLTQGQANGFPEYRLGKGRITSLHQRMRECFISFRADPFDPGSEEYRLLELYIMQKGNGLPIETPAVR